MYILIYGSPQTHHMWHHIALALAARFTSVAADIRGHGQSSKPAGVASYAKSATARYMISSGTADAFLRHRARSRRPRRAQAARRPRRLLVDHADCIAVAIFLDVSPTLRGYEDLNASIAEAFHH